MVCPVNAFNGCIGPRNCCLYGFRIRALSGRLRDQCSWVQSSCCQSRDDTCPVVARVDVAVSSDDPANVNTRICLSVFLRYSIPTVICVNECAGKE
jgi:hypothetical protein